jgi:methionyl-tRNA formyltransferase
MKIIFMGTPEFAVPSLLKLIEAGHTIDAVLTQPDRPSGRKQVITPPPVKLNAQQHGITVFQPEKIKTAEARELFEPLFKAADAGIVAAYGRILPNWMLDAPRLGCINVHSSLLPKYRGAAPINWAIANGERVTGVTIMQMDAGLDTGAILRQRAIEIGDRETAEELTPRLAELGAGLLIETLELLERGQSISTPQNNELASLAPMLKREDGEIAWEMTAEEILNRLRGFTPFPGCYTFFNSQRLEIIKASVETGSQDTLTFPPGAICQISRESFVVACGRQTRLRVTEVQPAGRRSMLARDFLNGAKPAPGDRFDKS